MMAAALPEIHPSAFVDDAAQLAQDVVVGPGCSITGEVRVGEGTRLLAQVHLQGPMQIGRGNRLYPFVCLGFAPQDRGYDPERPGAGVQIGDDNVFRESVTAHRATQDRPTTIGNRNYFMVNTHAGHDVVVGDDVTLANGALLAGHVQVGDRVIMGGNAGLHQFCRVGRMAMISGMGAIHQDVPPFCVVHRNSRVGSLNLVGLRRSGHRDHIRPLKAAFDILYRQGHTNSAAAQRILDELGDDPLCHELATFVQQSKRGLTGYRD